MKQLLASALMLTVMPGAVSAQPDAELTFFSNPGFSGARFTVAGPRTILRLPFLPRSAMLRGGGSWQVCAARDYRNPCRTIDEDQRDLRLGISKIESVRPVAAGNASGWREIARLNVADRADTDRVRVSDRRTYREVKICAERNTVRIRRAEAQLDGRQWQRLFVPLALAPGDCSNAIDLLGDERRISSVRFDYEAWSPGWRGGTLVVYGLRAVRPQPR